MRMRRAAGWLAVVLGVLLVILGAAASVAFGPDDTLTSAPQRLSSDSAVIATTPGAISIAGPTVEVTVTAADPDRSVFVGVGRDLEVADYLDDVAHLSVDDVSWPWDFAGAEADGRDAPAADPDDLDWWLTSDSDEQTASVSFPLPDGPVDVVAMDADRSPGLDVDVRVGLVQHGVFAGGLAVALIGVGVAVLGWMSRTRRREDAA